MAVAELSIQQALRQVTLDMVVDGRQAAIRIRVGAWLIKLAARVKGCQVEVTTEPTKPNEPSEWLVLEEGEKAPWEVSKSAFHSASQLET
jgi:hypothetical protein